MTPDLLPSLLLLDPQRRRGQKAQPAVASSSPPPLPLPAAAPPCSSRTPPPCGWTTTPERHAAVNSDAPGPVRVIDGNDDRRERHLREVVVGGRRAAADGRRRRRRRRAPRRAQDPLDARPSFCLLKAVSSAFSPFQPERWHEQSNCVSIERTHSAKEKERERGGDGESINNADVDVGVDHHRLSSLLSLLISSGNFPLFLRSLLHHFARALVARGKRGHADLAELEQAKKMTGREREKEMARLDLHSMAEELNL